MSFWRGRLETELTILAMASNDLEGTSAGGREGGGREGVIMSDRGRRKGGRSRGKEGGGERGKEGGREEDREGGKEEYRIIL